MKILAGLAIALLLLTGFMPGSAGVSSAQATTGYQAQYPEGMCKIAPKLCPWKKS